SIDRVNRVRRLDLVPNRNRYLGFLSEFLRPGCGDQRLLVVERAILWTVANGDDLLVSRNHLSAANQNVLNDSFQFPGVTHGPDFTERGLTLDLFSHSLNSFIRYKGDSSGVGIRYQCRMVGYKSRFRSTSETE